jgi:replicative DNA helicase
MDTTNNPLTEPYLILAQELLRKVYADVDQDQIHLWLLTQLGKLNSHTDETAVLTWLESFDYYDELLTKRQEKANQPDAMAGMLRWAWSSWNKMIDPMEPGLLAVIAAGDGMGKTTYAEMQAEYWANHNSKIAFVHFELNKSVMLDRRAARHTLISRRELKMGPYTPETIRRWHETRDRLKQWDGQITYIHTPGWSMADVVKQLNHHVKENECDAVVIDYLEKAAPSDKQVKLYGNMHWQREAHDVETVKNFAESTETPVILLAQMNKAGKDRGMDTLTRTAIRGSGEKTEKANIVVLLHRELDNENGYVPTVDVRIDKNTLGPTGTFQQWLDGEHFRVFDTQE